MVYIDGLEYPFLTVHEVKVLRKKFHITPLTREQRDENRRVFEEYKETQEYKNRVGRIY